MASRSSEIVGTFADPSDMDTPLTIPGLLARAADLWPTRPALTDANTGDSRTWRELLRDADVLAAQLVQAGVGKGIAVAIAALPNTDFVVWAHAVYRTGAVLAPLNLKFTPREIDHYLELIGREFSLVFVASEEFKDKFPRLGGGHKIAFDAASADAVWRVLATTNGAGRLPEEPGPDDPAYIIATSGSTGFPKPALIPHRAPAHFAQSCSWGMMTGPRDRYLNIMPMFHLSGLTICTATLPLTGTEVVLLPKFEPAAALATLEHLQITATCGWDGFFNMISQVPGFHPSQLRTLKRCTLAGSSRYMERLEAWGLETVFVFYGMTEGHMLTVMPPYVEDRKLRTETNGRVVRNVDLKIVDPEAGQELPAGEAGEIRYKGPTLMLRYVGLPELTAETIGEDGYLRSGDRGYLRDGYLHFIGRYKFMVKTGGENVSELEVENFLTDHIPSVAMPVVVGSPDQQYGEIVCAYIEWTPGGELTLAEVQAVCRGRLANFKMPRRIVPVLPGQWPLTASGKIDKSALRRMAADT